MHNFGNIKNTFNKVLSESILQKDRSRKTIFKEYLKTLRESTILKSQFIVLNNIESKFIEDPYLAGEYVKENVDSLRKFGQKNIILENSKLLNLVEKNKLTVSTEINKLYESLNDLIILKRDSKNIDRIQESFEYVRSFVMKPKIVENSNSTNISISPSILTSLMTSKFNTKYENVSESEKKVIRISLNGDDKEKESLFTEMIRETIDILNIKLETSNTDLKDKLLKTKDKLLSTEYKSETFTKDISKIFSLKEDLTK